MALVALRDASSRCGAKASHLGRLIEAGFPVPNGFVVPDAISDPGWVDDIQSALRRLGPGPFAVRSSGVAEDGTDASFAGQLGSVLGASTHAEVVEAVRHSANSGGSASAGSYANKIGQERVGTVPVIVQVLVHSYAAGVLFTRNPTSGENQIVINAARGLGEPVAAGSITPDTYFVHNSQVEVITGHQTHRLDFREERMVTTDMPEWDEQDEPVLTTDQARILAEVGGCIEDLFGKPQDIEWAMDADGLWILQARPITTRAKSLGTDGSVPGEVLLTGTAGSPGQAAGPVRIITNLDGFARFNTGDVLVCRTTSPAWTPLLARASAVVTETGGILAHAAIVAREFGIPAVLAARDATNILRDGQKVRVNGADGDVTAATNDE
jgi:pyruvate,water dikinase